MPLAHVQLQEHNHPVGFEAKGTFNADDRNCRGGIVAGDECSDVGCCRTMPRSCRQVHQMPAQTRHQEPTLQGRFGQVCQVRHARRKACLRNSSASRSSGLSLGSNFDRIADQGAPDAGVSFRQFHHSRFETGCNGHVLVVSEANDRTLAKLPIWRKVDRWIETQACRVRHCGSDVLHCRNSGDYISVEAICRKCRAGRRLSILPNRPVQHFCNNDKSIGTPF